VEMQMSEGVDRREMLMSLGMGAAMLSLGAVAGCAQGQIRSGSGSSATSGTKEKRTMHAMTAGNLRSAFGGESMA